MSERSPSSLVIQAILRQQVVPVFYHDDATYAQQIVDICYKAGIRVFEFANRGANAFAVFTKLRAHVTAQYPDLLLGTGTIYNAKEAEVFLEAGTDFVVQPITTADVAAVCRHFDVPWIPSALTPNEIFHATRLGAALVKIFPGSIVGPDYVRAVLAPMPNVKIMVTGGVEPTEENLRAWFEAGVSVVGMGSKLFKDSEDHTVLADRIAQVVQLAAAHQNKH